MRNICVFCAIITRVETLNFTCEVCKIDVSSWTFFVIRKNSLQDFVQLVDHAFVKFFANIPDFSN